jgi:cytoskeletal protein CcmA (bactofilin family)
MKKKIFIILATLILSSLLTTPVFAQGPGADGHVIFGENFTLEAEKTHEGDLVVFGGNVTMEKSSEINGSLVVFGGAADIQGDVDGDMVVFGGNVDVNSVIDGDLGAIGGNVNLGESAVVKGDIGLLGGRLNKAEGAVVEGDTQGFNKFDYNFDEGFEGPIPPQAIRSTAPFSTFLHWIGRIVGDIFWTFSLLVIMGLITWLVAAFMPTQMLNVRNTVLDAAPLSFGVGLMSWVVVGFSFVLILTICLAFVPIIAVAVLGIATLFGWIVLGQLLGERLLVASGQPQPGFISSSIVGVWVLTLVTNMPVIGEAPCIGWLLGFIGFIVGLIVSVTGLGAVLLTRFGARPYGGDSPYRYRGNPSPAPMGRRVRWTEPAPDVSAEDAPSSQDELDAKIKAALVEAAEEVEAEAKAEESVEDTPKKKPRKRPKPADDEPEA